MFQIFTDGHCWALWHEIGLSFLFPKNLFTRKSKEHAYGKWKYKVPI